MLNKSKKSIIKSVTYQSALQREFCHYRQFKADLMLMSKVWAYSFTIISCTELLHYVLTFEGDLGGDVHYQTPCCNASQDKIWDCCWLVSDLPSYKYPFFHC